MAAIVCYYFWTLCRRTAQHAHARAVLHTKYSASYARSTHHGILHGAPLIAPRTRHHLATTHILVNEHRARRHAAATSGVREAERGAGNTPPTGHVGFVIYHPAYGTVHSYAPVPTKG